MTDAPAARAAASAALPNTMPEASSEARVMRLWVVRRSMDRPNPSFVRPSCRLAARAVVFWRTLTMAGSGEVLVAAAAVGVTWREPQLPTSSVAGRRDKTLWKQFLQQRPH